MSSKISLTLLIVAAIPGCRTEEAFLTVGWPEVGRESIERLELRVYEGGAACALLQDRLQAGCESGCTRPMTFEADQLQGGLVTTTQALREPSGTFLVPEIEIPDGRSSILVIGHTEREGWSAMLFGCEDLTPGGQTQVNLGYDYCDHPDCAAEYHPLCTLDDNCDRIAKTFRREPRQRPDIGAAQCETVSQFVGNQLFRNEEGELCEGDAVIRPLPDNDCSFALLDCRPPELRNQVPGGDLQLATCPSVPFPHCLDFDPRRDADPNNDQLDLDCDGLADPVCGCDPGADEGQPCRLGGGCAGTTQCMVQDDGTVVTQCMADPVGDGTIELCDGRDNDCNGLIDDGPTPDRECAMRPTADRCGRSQCVCGASPECDGDRQCCAESCVNLTTDASHCGMCGRSCSPAEVCAAGTCIAAAGQPINADRSKVVMP